MSQYFYFIDNLFRMNLKLDIKFYYVVTGYSFSCTTCMSYRLYYLIEHKMKPYS